MVMVAHQPLFESLQTNSKKNLLKNKLKLNLEIHEVILPLTLVSGRVWNDIYA